MSYAKSNKVNQILVELVHHLPFSIFGVMSSLLVMAVLTYLATILSPEVSHHVHHDHHHHHDSAPEVALFHVFHAMHVLVSAVATTAMFWKHDNRNFIKAGLIGLLGSVTICGLSDVVVPYVGGLLLGTEMHFHICLIQEPWLVWPFAVTGVGAGFAVTEAFDRSTEYSHSMHVFISSAASLLFLIGFGLENWMHSITSVFFVTLFAVMIPCCLSDIVFPMVCTHRYCKHSKQAGHQH